MKKILLACSAGMSTSLLVSKMEAVAKQRGLDVKIWAIPESKIVDEVGKCDVLLLGPQVRFMLSKAQGYAKPHNVQVEVIPMVAYGRCDGAAILDRAMALIK